MYIVLMNIFSMIIFVATIFIFEMAAIIKNIVDFTGRLSMGMSKATPLKSWHNVVIQLMSATMKSFPLSIICFFYGQ